MLGTLPVQCKKLLSLISLCLLLGSSFSHAQLMMSAAKEQAIGKEIYEKILAEMPIYEDAKLVDYVRQVGNRLVAHSDSPQTTFTFTVIDDPDINAFATPGGYIYIHRGLIGYMRSEAQLAAVLAHEIAHVTARHSARQQRAQTTSNVAAGLLAILSRSGEVGEATALWGAATVRGYGRDMELEADGIGARTMAKAGYDRSAIIEVLSLLKDHERFEKQRARDAGREPRTYHGLFATHPRNDRRLAEIVAAGGAESGGETGVVPFRIATDKLLWGRGVQSSSAPRENRFYGENPPFRFDYPAGWSFSQTGNTISGAGPQPGSAISLEIRPRTVQSPEQYIKNSLGIGFIKKSQAIVQAGLAGHTGLVPSQSGPDQPIAVIYYQRGAYVFRGNLTDAASTDTASEEALNRDFTAIIRSFAPAQPARLGGLEPQRIHYVKATANTSFAQLASHLKLGKYGEQELRLINGYYPRGEPVAGEWIKIIR